MLSVFFGILTVIGMVALSPIFIIIAGIKSIYEILIYGAKDFINKGKDTKD